LLPLDLEEFWTACGGARLFEDRQYGQWGLVLLDPLNSTKATSEFRRSRQRDFVTGDVVIGRFLGDSDLLLVRCDVNLADFGQTLVAQPLDPRVDWDVVGATFGEFLAKFAAAEGRKFWESEKAGPSTD